MTPATHRTQLIGLLAEAAEIEHCLMCTYLYAAFSLKQGTDEDLQPQELAAVQRWRREIVAIATEEMLHLALVNNLAVALGARPHYRRFNLPIAPGLFPADVAVQLAPFDAATLDHFVYLERPADVAERDDERYDKPTYERHARPGQLMPMADDYRTVGQLYDNIKQGCEQLVTHGGSEAAVFIGPRASQLAPHDFRLPGLMTIGSLAEAKDAIDFIVHQGEGSPADKAGSHYARFCAIRREYQALLQHRAGFLPARPSARNPVMRDPVVDSTQRVHITAEPAARLLDVGNVCYELMMRLLTALSDVLPDSPARTARRREMSDQTLALMHMMADIGSALSRLPANPQHPGVTAGLTFTASRNVLSYLSGETATLLLAERMSCLAERMQSLAEGLPALTRHAQTLLRFARHWSAERDEHWPRALITEAAESESPSVIAAPEVQAGVPAAPASIDSALPVSARAAAPKAPADAAKPPDEATGRDVRVRFETQRCIHSRHCVLGEPEVFLANTPGEWLFPDKATPERIAIVAANCPSGAITYDRLDGGPAEAAPQVNVVRLRENGPLAFHAQLEIATDAGGAGSPFRATLCRCGQSSRKPFCDGSHNTAAFQASGEAATQESQPLTVRNGPLVVDPLRNGPLEVRGALEICTGTGRTIDRINNARLCRCGQSNTKPFCDGSHAVVGFVAEGV